MKKERKAIGIVLDQEVIDYYKAIARKLGLPYQSVINLALRQMMKENFELVITVDEKNG